jgi:hypothetical protein
VTVIPQVGQSSAALARIQRELGPGEKILWAGIPSKAALARSKIPVGLFGLVFFAFAIFWIVTARSMGSPATNSLFSYFWMFGIPFAAIGLWLVCKPAIAAISADSTLYGISDQRVMIVTKFPRYRVNSYAPSDLVNIDRRENSDGSGDIIFAQERSYSPQPWSDGISVGTTTSFEIPNKIGFFGIPEVRNVEALIHQFRTRTRP